MFLLLTALAFLILLDVLLLSLLVLALVGILAAA